MFIQAPENVLFFFSLKNLSLQCGNVIIRSLTISAALSSACPKECTQSFPDFSVPTFLMIQHLAILLKTVYYLLHFAEDFPSFKMSKRLIKKHFS